MKTVKKLCYSALVVLALVSLSACETITEQELLPLDIQAIQTRTFETARSTAFSSVVSVLQDLGYIINGADVETGFITAASPTRSSASLLDALDSISRNSTTKVTAFVEELREGQISVRLNFVINTSASYSQGQTDTTDKPILDESVYIEAFNKIENAIFIRS